MSFLRRKTVLRRVFASLERLAGNMGLIREAGKEFRLFSQEEVTLVRQLAEGRQRLADLREQRAEEARQLHSALVREMAESIQEVERRQRVLLGRQALLLQLCRQLVAEPLPQPGPGSSSGSSDASSYWGGSSSGSGLAVARAAASPAASIVTAAAAAATVPLHVKTAAEAVAAAVDCRRARSMPPLQQRQAL